MASSTGDSTEPATAPSPSSDGAFTITTAQNTSPSPTPPPKDSPSLPTAAAAAAAAADALLSDETLGMEDVSLGDDSKGAEELSKPARPELKINSSGHEVPQMSVIPPSPVDAASSASPDDETSPASQQDPSSSPPVPSKDDPAEQAPVIHRPTPTSAAPPSSNPPAPSSASSSPVQSTFPTRSHSSQSSHSTRMHRQNSSISSVAYPSSSSRTSLNTLPSTTLSSIHLLTALTTMSQSREAKRSQPLQKALIAALEVLKPNNATDAPVDQTVILEPLRLACETKAPVLQTTALDCISKLVSHSFFHTSSTDSPELGDTLTQIITATYTETTPDSVALQIVKSLLALVLSPTVPVHHSSLLKAVRTVYNIFLLSSDSINQMVAQGGLTQMVHHVFGRVNITPSFNASGSGGKEKGRKDSSASSSVPMTPVLSSATGASEPGTPTGLGIASGLMLETNEITSEATVGNGMQNEAVEPTELPTPTSEAPFTPGTPGGQDLPKITLSTFSLPNPNDAHPEEIDQDGEGGTTNSDGQPMSEQEMFVKDAFLVFRALCKLTMKPLMSEADKDLKSHAMRSKLLSLHLILTILQSHVALFASPHILIPSSSASKATFVQATKQYLCLSLSRNAVSPVGQVFELSVEIFWNVLKGLRGKMKKEIEVLLNEIFLPILEMRTSTIKQKSVILNVFLRLSQDPQALVEIYLNYDCDRTAIENIYERLVEIIAKIGSTHFAGGKEGDVGAGGVGRNEGGRAGAADKGPVIPPSLTTSAMGGAGSSSDPLGGRREAWAHLSPEVKLRRQSLECLVTVLRSLVQWGTAGPRGSASTAAHMGGVDESHPRASEDVGREGGAAVGMENGSSAEGRTGASSPTIGTEEDDPERFESAKQRKNALMEGIKKFNFKPKRGIQSLVENGFIRSSSPNDIAKFLLTAEGLSKAMIGEYLGEGDEANVAIMHAFVDMLDFRNMRFTEALRTFLQAFRLPGEAQKIDRFVLKFAERYIAGNPKTEFANADTAYILSFSVIMLNTDAHSPNIKRGRMSKVEFLKNNRGINDSKDLPPEFLGEIYDEIQANEIKMKDEVEAPQLTVAPGLANTIANVGRDLQKEAYVLQSEGMSNRSEALFKTMLRQQRRGGVKQSEEYYSASHLEHVRPMFEVAWMPFLAALSGPLQETDDFDVVELCLEGFKHAIKIVCLFELELERNAFVGTLAKFTFLNNLSEMKSKNVEAIKTLLEIAVSEGNYLKGSWRDILTCVSQLERMQLISNGIETPDIGRRSSVVSRKSTAPRANSRRGPGEDVASESRSAQVTVAADMVFSLSKHLSGSAIVEFVQALSDVSWEEIQSSSGSDHPRLFSLQKLVEISYYNMGRIRLEWSNIWQILGEHFNQVCCHNNANVSFFALDALRQLAMRFLEKDELSHFQFQKDFLKPFEFTMINNSNSDAKDMVLQCLQQMIQARSNNLRSGWRTMFGVFSAASKMLTERVATYAFELVTLINQDHFSAVVRYGAFADLTVCMVDFCKVSKFQKISLQAIEMLQGVVPTMLACPDCGLLEESATRTLPEGESPPVNDPMVKFWFPVLFSYYDVLMTGEDLEVRRVALDSLFNTLKTHGASFRADFWDSVCQRVLFPIFAPLRSGPMQEEMSFWVSTTMVTALRNLVDLYTFYFEILERFLDPLLDLLCFCIDQENDTLARIGTTCFQQLLEDNVRKLSPAKWERIVSAFVQLFQTTLAHMLFDENLRSENEIPDSPAYLNETNQPSTNGNVIGISPNDRRRIFRQIIRKCVLQLLLIETTHELLQNEEVYSTIPPEHLLRFLGVLDDSYQFARRFNADKDLRMALWKVGFMKQLPNLLKQESSSAATLVNNLLRMYNDPREDHRASRAGVLVKFIPLSLDILKDFNSLDPESQARHIAAWSPVVCQILQGYCIFDEKTFLTHLPSVYVLATDVLLTESAPEVREAVRAFFVKVGEVKGIVPKVWA